MDNRGALSVPYRSSYLQYKHNTSILIRWIVTTAESCVPAHTPSKPKNSNLKNKKSAAKGRTVDANLSSLEVTLSGLISLSGIIAGAKENVPSAILSLFDKVIQARTSAWECFEQFWKDNPDEDLKRSNESHRAFIDALQNARDILAQSTQGSSEPKSKPSKPANGSTPVKESAGPLEFLNKFGSLEVENLPTDDEAELEELVAGSRPSTTLPSDGPASAKGRGKGKKRKAVPKPLSRYKITSETEIYFAVCFFIKDLMELRR
jgi:hypothetical protein